MDIDNLPELFDQDIYSEEGAKRLFEEGKIDAMDLGFMLGYLDGGEQWNSQNS